MFTRILPLLACLGGSLLAAATGPVLEKQNLFVVGDNPDYTRYHIPGLAVSARGTVLAWCEARKTAGDWADIRVLLRRSTDDGRTWSAPVSIVDVAGPHVKNSASLRLSDVNATDRTYNNPVLIADRDCTVHMVFCLEYMRSFYQRSEDDGVSWSEPVEITDVFNGFRPEYDWKVLATGPNHGIQLRTGRLIVPVWLSTGTGGNAHRPSVTSTIYSDDGGKTWQRGEIAVPCTDEFVNPNETVAIELSDGRVMLNVRNESPNHRRLVTISPDGATGWSEPYFDDALIEPICMAGLVRYRHAGRSLLLFSNPDNLTRADGEAAPGRSRDRRNLSIRSSDDEGRTWSDAKTLEPGWSMYSDIAVTPAGTILCFYGSGPERHFAGEQLTLARFNLAWLLDDSAQATSSRPDVNGPATVAR